VVTDTASAAQSAGVIVLYGPYGDV